VYYFLKQIQPDGRFKEDLKELLVKFSEVNSGFPVNWEELWEK
jgi:hypothetical protein